MKKSKLVNEAVDDVVDVDAGGNVVDKASEADAISLNMYIFSNNPNDAPAQSLLQMFYEGTLNNTLGMMRAFNTETGQDELLLVGVEHSVTGAINTYPVAKILDRSAPARYKSPDGKGGWFEPLEATAT